MDTALHYCVCLFLDFWMNCLFLVRGKLYLSTVGVVTEPLFSLKHIKCRLKKFAPLKKCKAPLKFFSAAGSGLLTDILPHHQIYQIDRGICEGRSKYGGGAKSKFLYNL